MKNVHNGDESVPIGGGAIADLGKILVYDCPSFHNMLCGFLLSLHPQDMNSVARYRVLDIEHGYINPAMVHTFKFKPQKSNK